MAARWIDQMGRPGAYLCRMPVDVRIFAIRGLIPQGGGGNDHPPGRFQDGFKKGQAWIDPMAIHAGINFPALNAVQFKPVNKIVIFITRQAAQHGYPARGDDIRPAGQRARGGFKSPALAAVQFCRLIIKFFQ